MKKLSTILLVLLFFLTSFTKTCHFHKEDYLSDEEHKCLICILSGQLNNLTINCQNFIFLIVFLFILKIFFLKLTSKIFINNIFSRAPPLV